METNSDSDSEASDRWRLYFDGIVSLLEEAERHYGVSNQRYTQYLLERLEVSRSSCGELKAEIENSGLELVDSMQELLECLMLIHRKWSDYQDILENQLKYTDQCIL